MEFNKLVFAGLSVGCLAAAAGGSYLAVRQNQSVRLRTAQRDRRGHRRRAARATDAAGGDGIRRRDCAGAGAAGSRARRAGGARPARRAPAVDNSRALRACRARR